MMLVRIVSSDFIFQCKNVDRFQESLTHPSAFNNRCRHGNNLALLLPDHAPESDVRPWHASLWHNVAFIYAKLGNLQSRLFTFGAWDTPIWKRNKKNKSAVWCFGGRRKRDKQIELETWVTEVERGNSETTVKESPAVWRLTKKRPIYIIIICLVAR